MSLKENNAHVDQTYREILSDVKTRVERIEKAMLGDSEHGIWGYKNKFSHIDNKIDEVDKRLSKEITTLHNQVQTNSDRINKTQSNGAVIGIISVILGGALGSVLMLIFGG